MAADLMHSNKRVIPLRWGALYQLRVRHGRGTKGGRGGCVARGARPMKYTIILTEKSDGGIHVSIPALPDCTVEAGNRDEAINLARHMIAETMSRSEIVLLEVPQRPKAASSSDEVPW